LTLNCILFALFKRAFIESAVFLFFGLSLYSYFVCFAKFCHFNHFSCISVISRHITNLTDFCVTVCALTLYCCSCDGGYCVLAAEDVSYKLQWSGAWWQKTTTIQTCQGMYDVTNYYCYFGFFSASFSRVTTC